MKINFKVDCDQKKVLNSKKWTKWIRNLNLHFIVKEVNIHKVDMFGDKVGFIYVEVDCTDLNNNSVPGLALIRGDSVSILTVIKNTDNNEKYVVFTEQSRVPVGKKLLESPAGMVDEGKVSSIAIEELKEEIGFDIFERSNLIKLSGGYSSPGGIDEYIDIFAYELSLSTEQINALDNKTTGNLNENEVIKLRIFPFDLAINFTESLITRLAILEYKRISND